MKVLIDTHALIWWLEGSKRLTGRALSILSNSNHMVLVSAASAWELAIKVALGKLSAAGLVTNLPSHISEEGFIEQPITVEHAVRAGMLPAHHRDPFDRLLAAQAQSLDVAIVSGDKIFDRYGIRRIW